MGKFVLEYKVILGDLVWVGYIDLGDETEEDHRRIMEVLRGSLKDILTSDSFLSHSGNVGEGYRV